MPDAEVRKFWKRHQQWAELANRLKRKVRRARVTALILIASGAVLQTLGTTSAAKTVSTVSAILGTLALTGAAIVAKQFLAPSAVRGWLRARSVSEGLKSAIYRYLAEGLPYAGDDRAQAFKRDCDGIDSYFASVATELAGIVLKDEKPLPSTTDADSYIAQRIQTQIKDYYLPHAAENASSARSLSNAVFAISLLAAGLSGLVSALHISATDPKGLGAWVAVVTTIGAAVAAHATANRYAEQAQLFYATARELEDAISDWTNAVPKGSPAAWAQFVGRCEDAISIENRGWMAKLSSEEKGAGPGGA